MLLRVCHLLEQFRGLMRALISDDVAVFEFCSQYFPAFVQLLEIYKNVPEVIILILKFFCDYVQYQSDNFNDEQVDSAFFWLTIFRLGFCLEQLWRY